MPQSKTTPSAVNSLGLLYGFLAYGSWGILPIYWKLLSSVTALEVLCHRMIWSTLFLLLVLGIRKELRSFFSLFQSPRLLLFLLGTATLLACNWGTYIYAVNIDRVVETSLGYFMTPLLNILLGCLVLRERLSRLQGIAVGLAVLGVANFIWGFGAVPWFALILASSFAFYGLCRKLIPVSPLCGITIETLLLAPFALLWLGLQPDNAFGSGVEITLLLCLAGVVTSLPLFCFNTAAKLLPLSTLGFLQYLAPSLQLLLGIFLYGEPFTRTHFVSFGLIWTALGLYTVHLLQHREPSPQPE
ncbi:MAG: EamA family transporter RarD [Prochlorotrichaceae cyanobacterium]|jgi:chloramphenicol-sensitive protein RarD